MRSHPSLDRLSERRFRSAALVALLALSPFGAPPGAAAQQVEVLVGGVERTPRGPGIRVVAMRDEAPGRTRYRPVQPLTGREVVAIQRALRDAGQEPGPLDGRIGPRVRAALAAFQAEAALPVCGCVDGVTLEALGLRLRVVQTVLGGTGPADVEILAPVRTPTPVPDPPPPPPDPPAASPPAPTTVWAVGWPARVTDRTPRVVNGAGPRPGRAIGAAPPGRIVRVLPPPRPR